MSASSGTGMMEAAVRCARPGPALARAHGVLSLVDSVSGIGGAPLECDAWELDLVLTASQKALALPAGLAFAVASERYMSHVASAPSRGVYLDLAQFADAALHHQTPNTPALSLLYALNRQLADIAATGGVTARWARHDAMAALTGRWADALGETVHPQLGALTAPGIRSPTVTAITLPTGLESDIVVRAVEERGFVVGGGNGATRRTTFRIGHMGDHTVASLERCLDACTDALRDLVPS